MATSASRRLLVSTVACIFRVTPSATAASILPPLFVPTPPFRSILRKPHPGGVMVLTRSSSGMETTPTGTSTAAAATLLGRRCTEEASGGRYPGTSHRPLPEFSAFAYSGPSGMVTSAMTTPASPMAVTPSTSDNGDSPPAPHPPPSTPIVRSKTPRRHRATRPGVARPLAVGPKSKRAADARTMSSSSGASASPTPGDKKEGGGTPKKRNRKSPSGGSGSSPRKKRPRIEPGSLTPPPDWERTYQLVRELRSDRSAPVDTDGGHALPERHLGESVRRFQVLIALMLSSQTKDAIVGETMRALQRHGLTVRNIRDTSHEDLNGLIRKVGFHNNKTKYIKGACEILLEKYGGDIPPTAREMMDLPGVGPKMAYIIESEAFGTTSGIGVDTHMHRMFNDLGWVNSKNPEGTREQLEGWLPREKWAEVNVLWVGIGQETQQQKEKALKKALACSQPAEALKLMRRLGLKVDKEAKKFGLVDDVELAMTTSKFSK